MRIEAYISGKEKEIFQYGDERIHRKRNLWKWKIVTSTELLGFNSQEEANQFFKKYL